MYVKSAESTNSSINTVQITDRNSSETDGFTNKHPGAVLKIDLAIVPRRGESSPFHFVSTSRHELVKHQKLNFASWECRGPNPFILLLFHSFCRPIG